MTSDAQRWNDRYAHSSVPTAISPHPVIVEAAKLHDEPQGLRAGDIACGWGDAGLWLAAEGFDVTCFDVSSVALQAVAQRAADSDINIRTAVHDTQTQGTPTGPWDLLCCTHYLDRNLLGGLSNHLNPGGIIAVAIATTTNLERHERPSKRFLLELGELIGLTTANAPDLHILRADETWRTNEVHEAWIIAQLPI